MLWRKVWFETRFRFLLGVAILCCLVIGVVMLWPKTSAMFSGAESLAVGGALGRELQEAVAMNLRDLYETSIRLGRGLDPRGEAALDRVGLSDSADERVHGYSQGMRQRVALARALHRRAEVLLLDEPYAGLDAQAKQLVDEVIDEARTEGRTVVLATHDQGRGGMASRTISMDAGGIVPVPHAREASPAPIPVGEVQGAGVG